jgi:hypothetical protein
MAKRGWAGGPYFEFFVFWQQNSRRECPHPSLLLGRVGTAAPAKTAVAKTGADVAITLPGLSESDKVVRVESVATDLNYVESWSKP